eukprot:8040875-Karenia_brevis.AAC.1
MNASSLLVVCIDMNHIGSGDVIGHGPLTIATARQNRNHFVPLLESINCAGNGAGQQPTADVHGMDFDSATEGDEQMAPEAMSDDQSSLFGDSTESSE